MTRGMPGDRHVKVGVSPCPPVSWSLTLASKTARYSGVNGAFEASTQRGAVVRSHWPLKSGYLLSSNAWAPPAVISSAAASVVARSAAPPAGEPLQPQNSIAILL